MHPWSDLSTRVYPNHTPPRGLHTGVSLQVAGQVSRTLVVADHHTWSAASFLQQLVTTFQKVHFAAIAVAAIAVAAIAVAAIAVAGNAMAAIAVAGNAMAAIAGNAIAVAVAAIAVAVAAIDVAVVVVAGNSMALCDLDTVAYNRPAFHRYRHCQTRSLAT